MIMAGAETGAWHGFRVGVLWDTCVLVTVEYFDLIRWGLYVPMIDYI